MINRIELNGEPHDRKFEIIIKSLNEFNTSYPKHTQVTTLSNLMRSQMMTNIDNCHSLRPNHTDI